MVAFTTDQIVDLVRDYGRERYRHGKAVIRHERATTHGAAERNIKKAKKHAENATQILSYIRQAVNPYRDHDYTNDPL